MDNALHPDEMSAGQRLGEVARILAEGVLRRRLRDCRNPKIVHGLAERHLDDMRAPTVERNGEDLVIRIPMTFKRWGGRREIIVPDGLPAAKSSKTATQDPLVVALARAHRWQEFLDEGRYTSITALAEALDVDRSYVGRILRLTLLAPDIIEAILRGDEPSGLSLERLTKRLPLLWSEQRKRLGFSPSRSTDDQDPEHAQV